MIGGFMIENSGTIFVVVIAFVAVALVVAVGDLIFEPPDDDGEY